MKPVQFISSLLVIASVIAAAATTGDVLEMDSNPVKPDTLYYIQITSPGRYVTHSQQNYETKCPQAVVLTPPLARKGALVRFYPVDHGTDESPSFSIQFVSESWPCYGDSKVWRANTQSPHITTDGSIGDKNSTFKIETRGGDTYDFAFCPNPATKCMYVGVFGGDDGLVHHGLRLVPIPLRFVEIGPTVGIKMFPSQ